LHPRISLDDAGPTSGIRSAAGQLLTEGEFVSLADALPSMYLGAGRASAAQSLAGVEIAVQHVTRPGPR
jgi:hypothetical protein